MKTAVTKTEIAMPDSARDDDKNETLLTKIEMVMAKNLNDDQIIAWNEIAVA